MTPADVRKPAPGRIIVAPEYPGCIGTGDAPAIGQSGRRPGRFCVGPESACSQRPLFADDPRPEWFDSGSAARRRYLELARPWLAKVQAERARIASARAALARGLTPSGTASPSDFDATLAAALTLSDSGQL